ncbi:hypothetical protein FQ042_16035 [Escherichia coli]|nr:hypothetical protein [Escherichia coli]
MHPQFLVWCLTFGAHFKNDGHYFCGAGGNRPDGQMRHIWSSPVLQEHSYNDSDRFAFVYPACS